MIVLPVEDWQEALKPLIHLQDNLLNTSKPQSCRITQIMRDLQLHLVVLQRIPHHIAVSPAPGSNMHEAVIERGHLFVIEARQKIPEKDLDRCFSGLLSCLQKTDSLVCDTSVARPND